MAIERKKRPGAKGGDRDVVMGRSGDPSPAGEERVHDLAETFRALSDPTRVRIILALSRQEMCVCDLAERLGITGSAVSHQLRLLRGQRLVRYRKEGKATFYALDDEHIRHLFEEGMRHVENL